jgi:hypothetical protein
MQLSELYEKTAQKVAQLSLSHTETTFGTKPCTQKVTLHQLHQ